MTDEERLRAYDEALASAVAERDQIAGKMEELRAQGKVKSVSYQQYFAMRHELDAMLRRFEERGLM